MHTHFQIIQSLVDRKIKVLSRYLLRRNPPSPKNYKFRKIRCGKNTGTI